MAEVQISAYYQARRFLCVCAVYYAHSSAVTMKRARPTPCLLELPRRTRPTWDPGSR